MSQKWSRVTLAVLVILDLVFLFTVNYPAVEINPYLLRDIGRAFSILSGHLVLVGSDFTSGSYAPGPFYYLTIAPVLALFGSPFSVVAFSMFVKVAAQALFSVKFSQVTKVPAPVMYLVMSSSAFLLERFIWVNNSSFIGPFIQIFAVLMLIYWHCEEGRNRTWLLFMISLFVGGSMQTHFSLILLAPFALFVIRAKKPTDANRSRDPLVFTAGLLFTMLPFLVAYINDRYLHFFDGPVFFRNQLGVQEFTKDWWHLFRREWRVFHTLNIFNAEVVVLYFYILLKSAWLLLKKSRKDLNQFDRIFLINGLLTLLFTAWVLSGSYMRYFTIFFVPALAYLVYDIYHLATKVLRKQYLVFATFVIACMFIRFQFYGFPKNLGHQGKCEACIFQMNAICDYFNSRDISFEQFSKSTYEFFPSDSHGSLYYTHHCFKRQEGVNPENKTKYLFADSDQISDQNAFVQSLSRLPIEVRPYYSDINRFKKEIETRGFTFFSVEQDKPLNTEARYSNLTYSYDIDPAEGEAYSTQSLKKDGYSLHKATFCSSPVFCDLYVSSKLENQKLHLHFGSRMLQIKTELRPINTRIKNLRLEYVCDQKPMTIEVASILGLVTEDQQNETLSTPLEIATPANCTTLDLLAVSMDSVEINANNSKIETRTNERIPLKKL